ncbi:MAG TPA: HEAT repeat domain-containing protein [Polyangiaceae bacterium LLY-WYZ-15_(1-7)]|nr:HEAT repeat domain-containing protein [Polyangiaceae bacterium LLY-WYZ-15_(1-7)]
MSKATELERALDEMREASFVDPQLVARVAAFGAAALDRLLRGGPVRGLPHPTAHARLVQDVVGAVRDPRAIPQLVELVTRAPTDPAHDPFLGAEAARALAAIGAAAVPALIRPEPWEHGLVEVCEVLADIGGPEAAETVARWSRRRPVKEDTRRMTRALARLGAVQALWEALEDADAGLRAAALRDLALLEDPGRLDMALRALEDPGPSVREAAARTLLGWGDERAVTALEARLEDANQRVRQAAKQALGRITRRRY